MNKFKSAVFFLGILLSLLFYEFLDLAGFCFTSGTGIPRFFVIMGNCQEYYSCYFQGNLFFATIILFLLNGLNYSMRPNIKYAGHYIFVVLLLSVLKIIMFPYSCYEISIHPVRQF